MPVKEKKEVGKPGKDESSGFQIKYFILTIIVILIFVLIIGNGFLDKIRSDKTLFCGDGTLYETCSLTQPYFCSEGFLERRASACGCPDILIKQEEYCVSKYQTDPKVVELNYTLRGEQGVINFPVYGGMVDYLSELSRSIFHNSGETPSRADFKLKNIDEEEQRELLLHLVKKIQNITSDEEDQARIAISLVQNIPFGFSEKEVKLGGGRTIDYSRYPYEVLYDMEGICGEKSELLAFLLRELGYGVAFFYHAEENHESLGIECPVKQSLDETGYCFIETTGPSIITDDSIEYVGGIELNSEPEVIPISTGASLGKNLYEYDDADVMKKLRNRSFLLFKKLRLRILKEKYGLVEEYHPA
jgi:hypothetical protein